MPTAASVAVPHAKVYLKSPFEQENVYPPGSPQSTLAHASDSKRFRFSISILSLEGCEPSSTIKCTLFVVKGNPLMITSTPLPCFSTGTDFVCIEIRAGDDSTDLNLQVIITDMGSQFALPVDELVEFANSPESVERSITTWDTQTGCMRGTCLVNIRSQRDEPMSVAEILELRKRTIGQPPADSKQLSKVTSSEPSAQPVSVVPDIYSGDATHALTTHRSSLSAFTPPRSALRTPPKGATPPAQEDDTYLSLLTNKANDLLASARAYAEPIEEKAAEKSALIEEADRLNQLSPAGRSRKRGVLNFSVSTIQPIPE